MVIAMTPLPAAYGPVLFYGAMCLHGVLAVTLAFAWIRFTQREVQRGGPAFQFGLVDAYAAVAGLLPWLWLVSLVLRMQPADSDAALPDFAGIVWGLCLLLFFLICGWILGVLHRQTTDRANRASFPEAFLTTIVLQYLFAAFFVALSMGYFAFLGAIARRVVR